MIHFGPWIKAGSRQSKLAKAGSRQGQGRIRSIGSLKTGSVASVRKKTGSVASGRSR